MLLSALELYIYVKFINLFIMAKKEVSLNYFINLDAIAKIFEVKKTSLSFGIAETILDDDECDFIPIVAINGTDEYINLISGRKEQTSYATGVKQNMFKAVVVTDTKEQVFVFNTNRSKCVISKEALVKNFGDEIIKFKKILRS